MQVLGNGELCQFLSLPSVVRAEAPAKGGIPVESLQWVAPYPVFCSLFPWYTEARVRLEVGAGSRFHVQKQGIKFGLFFFSLCGFFFFFNFNLIFPDLGLQSLGPVVNI